MASRHRCGHMRGAKGRRKRLALAKRDGARCFYCRTPFGDVATEATFDHYVPYALWPTNERFNLVLACSDCNVRKGHALPIGLLIALRPWLTRAELAVAA
ncbi:HNH endonuclease [Streptomyces sp. NPDC002685]|uniref:HNH endonuclease n=1 Tax=Streptomyces sp. NPDC002685 TaxID=3154540 RepID=UPI0033197740